MKPKARTKTRTLAQRVASNHRRRARAYRRVERSRDHEQDAVYASIRSNQSEWRNV